MIRYCYRSISKPHLFLPLSSVYIYDGLAIILIMDETSLIDLRRPHPTQRLGPYSVWITP